MLDIAVAKSALPKSGALVLLIEEGGTPLSATGALWKAADEATGGAISRALGVVVLAMRQSPQEGCERQHAQYQGGRNQDQQAIHHPLRGPPPRRSALTITKIEDDDMAIAASRGVTTPMIAIGTAARL